MKSMTVTDNDAGQRADKFLQKALPELPKSMLYKGMRQKNIKLNRKRCEPSSMLCAGDILDIYLPDDALKAKKREMPSGLPPADIIYEDDNILILDKPAGIPCHSSAGDSLLARATQYLAETGAYRAEENASFAPALCNRLDLNTAGLVIAAKNSAALRLVNECIRSGMAVKKYYCRTDGKPPRSADILTAYHRKDESRNMAVITDKPAENSKKIITEYRVISENEDSCILEVTLHTGRSHQIRAQLAHIGCPIAGDVKYGGKRVGGSAQQLCAHSLELRFPADSALAYLSGKRFESRISEKIFGAGGRSVER